MVTWLVAASRDTVSRLFFVTILTGAIGFGPFHHALLGSTEVLSAMFLGVDVSLADYGHFLPWTTVGNVVGGSVLVATLNYGHVALAGEDVSVDFEAADRGE